MNLVFLVRLLSVCLLAKIAYSSFVYGMKSQDFQALPDELIKYWTSDNKYGVYYEKTNMFTIAILPDCDDSELLETTVKSLLLTSNRNLIHQIIVLYRSCQNERDNEIINGLKKSSINKLPISMIETELQELGDLQNFAGSIATGEILLFVPAATLFPRNWMSIIMRNLSDNYSSISVPNFTILKKNSWAFSTEDLVFSPKIMFSKIDFEIFNLHNSNNNIPMFFSPIFAVKKTWWDSISKLSDSMLNAVLKEKVNLDLGLRTWACGGRVIQTKSLVFGISKIETSQPSLEVRNVLIESWIEKGLAEVITRNSDKTRGFVNSPSNNVIQGLIEKRNEAIKDSNCDLKHLFISKFENELYEIGAFEKPTTQIELSNSDLCLTAIQETPHGDSFNIKLSKCSSGGNSQSFYIDTKRSIVRHLGTNTCINISDSPYKSEQIPTSVNLQKCDYNNNNSEIEYWKNRLIFGSLCIQASIDKTHLELSECVGEGVVGKEVQIFNIKTN